MTVIQRLKGPLCVLALALSFAVPAMAQAPSVSGTVFDDMNLDGLITVGEELMGVTVELFEDDGDGLFSPTVDSLITTQITDINGHYSFGGLGMASNYFVQQTAQSVGGISITGSVSGLLSPSTVNTLIDDFASQQQVEGNPVLPIGATNLTSSTVIGGQRDLHVEYLSGPAESTLYANPFGLSEVLEFNQSAGVIAIATVTWDGVDADLTTTPSAGLGGIDITNGGLNDAFAFDIGIDAAGSGENLVMRLFTGSDVSTAQVLIPVTNGTATSSQIIPLSQFVGAADLTNIDAIQLELGGNNTSIDAQLGPIGLIGSAVADFSVETIPEPSTVLLSLFAMVWLAGSKRRRRRLR